MMVGSSINDFRDVGLLEVQLRHPLPSEAAGPDLPQAAPGPVRRIRPADRDPPLADPPDALSRTTAPLPRPRLGALAGSTSARTGSRRRSASRTPSRTSSGGSSPRPPTAASPTSSSTSRTTAGSTRRPSTRCTWPSAPSGASRTASRWPGRSTPGSRRSSTATAGSSSRWRSYKGRPERDRPARRPGLLLLALGRLARTVLPGLDDRPARPGHVLATPPETRARSAIGLTRVGSGRTLLHLLSLFPFSPNFHPCRRRILWCKFTASQARGSRPSPGRGPSTNGD